MKISTYFLIFCLSFNTLLSFAQSKTANNNDKKPVLTSKTKTTSTTKKKPVEKSTATISKAQTKAKQASILEQKKAVQQNSLYFSSTEYDFGRINEGQVVEHQFEFTNISKSPVEILDVQVTCGCTIPSYPFIPIMPGEKHKIGVRFDSKGKLGQQKPTITVITNGNPSSFKLNLSGLVVTD